MNRNDLLISLNETKAILGMGVCSYLRAEVSFSF